MEHKKISFDIGSNITKSFTNSISKVASKFDYLSIKSQKLNNQKSLISKFNTESNASAKLQAKLDRQKAMMSDLIAKDNQTGNASERLKLRISELGKQIDSTNTSLKKQQEIVEESSRHLKDNGIDVSNIAQENKRLSQEIEKNEKGFARRSKSIHRIGTSYRFLRNSILGVAGASTSMFLVSSELAGKFAEYGDSIAKTSRNLGINAQSYQKLSYAAGLSGIQTQNFANSMMYMEKNTDQATLGIGEAKKAFDKLGLSAIELKNLKPEQSLGLIADRLSKLKNKQERVDMATLIFGRSGTSMIELLKNGSKGIEDLGDRAVKTGNVLTAKDLKNSEENRDAYQRMIWSISGLKNSLYTSLLPAVTNTFDSISDWLEKNRKHFKSWGRTATNIFNKSISALKMLGTAFHEAYSFGHWLFGGSASAKATRWGIGIATSVVLVSRTLFKLTASLTAVKALTKSIGLLNPFGLAVAGGTAVVGTMWTYRKQLTHIFNETTDYWRKILGLQHKVTKPYDTQYIKHLKNGKDMIYDVKDDTYTIFTPKHKPKQVSNHNTVNLHQTIHIHGNADKHSIQKMMDEALKKSIPMYKTHLGW
ncbi:hypothetical protein [Francisella sp. SYW-9]|uniref:hypothetical protein n=1 Tax=Francisella sp. SYW-9 TaxID=2610888 RepID=UPI00123D97B6|nr:hypothetical protein [Francisella sp. SYW-9]